MVVMHTRSVTRRIPVIAALACSLSLLLPQAAFAAASVSNGKFSCTVTSVVPTLSKTSLTAKASITCTSATTASVYIGLSEMDGTTEQVVQTPKLVSVAVTKANTAFAISGTTVTCLNTETGNEEYVSKVDVVLTTSTCSTVSSSWDLKAPANDAYAC